MRKPHFVGWDKIEEGYFTKTTLKNEYGLKPRDVNEHDVTLKAYMQGKWRDFVLYHIDNTVEIKKRKIADIDPTIENLSQALYVINKSAKVSRDTKNENYQRRRHGIVSAAKKRQEHLYSLKDATLNKLLKEKLANVKGYHKQKSSYNDEYNYLILIEFGDFTFHKPSFPGQVENLVELGEVNKISSEKTFKAKINFFESEKLLEKYIS